jgi:hypothetical protein
MAIADAVREAAASLPASNTDLTERIHHSAQIGARRGHLRAVPN